MPTKNKRRTIATQDAQPIVLPGSPVFFHLANTFCELWQQGKYAKALLVMWLIIFSGFATATVNQQSTTRSTDLSINSIDTDPHDGISTPHYANTPLWKDPELHEAILNVPIAHYPTDAALMGMSETEYAKVSERAKRRIRQNLIHAANPTVLKRLLSSPEHTIVVRPTALRPGGEYATSHNRVIIGVDDRVNDDEIREALRNEYFHAMTCVRPNRPLAKKDRDCLSDNEVEALDAAIKKGSEKVRKFEKRFKAFLAKSNDASEPDNELKDFLFAVRHYVPIRYHEISASQKLMTVDKHKLELERSKLKLLPDGRLLVPVELGAKLKGVEVPDDFYATTTQKNNHVQVTYSFLKDDSPISRARAFFADVFLRQQEYTQPGMGYFDKPLWAKIGNQASDIACLPTALKEFFYQDFCKISAKMSGVNDYCVIPEITLTCDENSVCVVTPKP